MKLKPQPFVQAVWKSFMAESGLEPRLLGPGFRITSVTPGKVNFEMDILQQHTNRLGTIHGGTLASIVDLGGSLAVAATGRFSTGVTTDLNVTYLSPGGVAGQKLYGEAECDKIGKTLAYTKVVFYNEKKQLAARGSHTKFVANSLQSPDQVWEVPERWAKAVEEER